MMRLRLALILAMLAGPVFAVQPDEVLPDPALEARARVLSKDLRCLVCRNENIDESNADLARDLRLAVRERLVAGDTNEEVISYLVDRYGEYVLLRPPATGMNLILWMAGPLMLLTGIGVAAVALRRRPEASRRDTALTSDERARVDAILKD